MNKYEKLLQVQNELKAPKGQFNAFGKYKYRNCEDILEAVKPLLLKVAATLTLSDEVVLIGDRTYIRAIATFFDVEKSEGINVSAYAREDLDKKGMDLAQITGSVSSYARKYALNGLFCIDDTKDSDATNTHDKATTTTQTAIDNHNAQITPPVTPAIEETPSVKAQTLIDLGKKHGLTFGQIKATILKNYKKKSIDDLTVAEYAVMQAKIVAVKGK